MPSPNEEPDTTSLLLKTITKESLFRLVDILREIIKHSPEGRKIAAKWLLAAQDDVKSEPVATSLSSTAPPTPAQPVKEQSIAEPTSSTMTSRFETCLYCLERFDVTKNSATSCRYHVEPDVVDEEFFKDEIVAGIDVDSDEFREAWPDKFYYNCCGRDLLEEVCQVGWHKTAERPCKTVVPEVQWG